MISAHSFSNHRPIWPSQACLAWRPARHQSDLAAACLADRVFRKTLTRLVPKEDLTLLEQLGLPTLKVRLVVHRNGRRPPAFSFSIFSFTFSSMSPSWTLLSSGRSAWTRRPQISWVLPVTGCARMAVISTSSSSLRRFDWRSARCTSRSRPGSAAGLAMSIGCWCSGR